MQNKLTKLILNLCMLASLWGASAQDLPNDLVLITTGYPVPPTAWFSIAHWPTWPPIPIKSFDGDEYYSPSWGADTIFVDDTLSTYQRFERNGIDPWEPGDPIDTNAVQQIDYHRDPEYDLTTNYTDLWLSITDVTNIGGLRYADLVIHNTTNTLSYEIISSTNVLASLTNWVSEGVWKGIVSNTPAQIPWRDRTNNLFFRARVFDGSWPNGFPQNGSLVLQLSDTNPLVGWINGATNIITPGVSNYITLHPPLWEVNLGYDASDFATETNYLKLWPSQKVQAMYGRSDTISNLCLSYNPLTNIDVHGWAKLYDLEAWHCTNLLFQNVTQCPKLHRVCFESLEDLLHGLIGSLDFTGSTNIADVRAACNAFTNITFGPGGGSQVFHFCTRASHANFYLPPLIQGVPFANLPSLKQLWVWADYSYEAPIDLAYTNAPDLESLQANNNGFMSMNLYGQIHLTNAILYDCPILTNINVAGCSNLLEVSLVDDPLSIAQVDTVLTNLDTMGKSNRIARINSVGSQTACPSAAGMTAISNLVAKHWIVQYNDPNGTAPAVSHVFTTPGSNDCVVSWQTLNIVSDSTVYYGTNTANQFASDAALTVNHSITLTGLLTNTLYKFVVASTHGTNTGWSATNTFRTLGRGPNTNRIWFVSTSRNVSMQSEVGSVAKTTWLWADGSTNTNSNASIDFGSVDTRTNYLIVDPMEALTKFGVGCQPNGPDTTLSGAGGFINYPNIAGLYFYYTFLSDLSLVGMTNLTYVAAAATMPSTATENQWFIDVANAQTNIATIGTEGYMCGDPFRTFFAPSGVADSNSLSARTAMTNAGWTIRFVP